MKSKLPTGQKAKNAPRFQDQKAMGVGPNKRPAGPGASNMGAPRKTGKRGA